MLPHQGQIAEDGPQPETPLGKVEAGLGMDNGN